MSIYKIDCSALFQKMYFVVARSLLREGAYTLEIRLKVNIDAIYVVVRILLTLIGC